MRTCVGEPLAAATGPRDEWQAAVTRGLSVMTVGTDARQTRRGVAGGLRVRTAREQAGPGSPPLAPLAGARAPPGAGLSSPLLESRVATGRRHCLVVR